MHPSDSHESSAQQPSPPIVSHPRHPVSSNDRSVNGWSSGVYSDPTQTAILSLGQTEVGRVTDSGSLKNDADRLVFVDAYHDSRQENSSHMEGGVCLPVEPGTDVKMTDGLPEHLGAAQSEDGAENFAKQLRRFQKRTDTILLKRTQWRQEHDKLENCRRYLRESTNELMSALQIQISDGATQGNPKPKKKRRRKLRMSSEVTGGGVPKERLVPPLSQADSEPSTAEVGRDASESVKSDGTVNSRETIHTLFQRYLDDLEALSRQDILERTVMEDLSNLEFHVTKTIEDIQRTMRSSNFAEDLRTELLEGSLLSQDSSVKSPSEEDLPPLIAEYFDLQGNIGIYLERLQELDHEHQVGLQERDFVRDRGDPLEPSDEEFYSNYNAQREQTEQDLNKARDQLEIVDARCEQAGLDPEMHRNAERTPRSVSPVPYAGPEPIRLITGTPTDEAAPHSPLEANTSAQSSQRIERWLRRIPDEDLDVEPAQPPLVPQYEEKKLSEGSLASFELRSFDLGLFGLPRIQETSL